MSGNVIESYNVATTLLANRIVIPSTTTAGVVVYPASITDLPMGITKDQALDTTSSLPIQLTGKAYLFFNDTVTVGSLVGSDSSGRGVPYAAVTAPTAFIGRLIGPTIAATGTIAQIALQPGFSSIP